MNNFIWTESFGETKKGAEVINEFIKNNKNIELNVFTLNQDIKYLPISKNITYHTFNKLNFISCIYNRVLSNFQEKYNLNENLLKNFHSNNNSKAYLWAYIFKNFSHCSNFIHFDKNLNLKKNFLSELIILSMKYDIVAQFDYRGHIFLNKSHKKYYYEPSSLFTFKPTLCSSIKRLPQKKLEFFLRCKKNAFGKITSNFCDKIFLEIFINKGHFKFLNIKEVLFNSFLIDENAKQY
tara:strand:+ start:12 stop:722 length:711 start_codon:yes stop_codon:yes gene_type:complete